MHAWPWRWQTVAEKGLGTRRVRQMTPSDVPPRKPWRSTAIHHGERDVQPQKDSEMYSHTQAREMYSPRKTARCTALHKREGCISPERQGYVHHYTIERERDVQPQNFPATLSPATPPLSRQSVPLLPRWIRLFSSLFFPSHPP